MNHKPTRRAGGVVGLLLLSLPAPGFAQQLGDSVFAPALSHPAFEADARSHVAEFTAESLQDAELVVIANALHPSNAEAWTLPTPSAFTPAEIAALRRWVEEGGALLLIADHMPFLGAAADLAAEFGFEFSNGFAMHPTGQGLLTFRRSDGSLGRQRITEGGRLSESIDSVATFTGQAFESPDRATDLLVMPDGWISLEPTTAWEFLEDNTPRHGVAGWSQGSVMEFGQGRLAVFGEAAMFTAQRAGRARTPIGMNAPQAGQNAQFVANLVRWLVGAGGSASLDGEGPDATG